jgi:hypothetical protein
VAGSVGEVISPSKLIGGKKQIDPTSFTAKLPLKYFTPIDRKYKPNEKTFASSTIPGSKPFQKKLLQKIETPSFSELRNV